MTASPLVSPSELAALLAEGGDRAPVVLDVRWRLGASDGHEEYLRGHVPGASYVDLDTELADPPGRRGRHPLPDDERFAAAMRRCGVRRDRPVVVYDAVAGTAAARCWWLLRHHRHDDVQVLDGGWQAWLAEGGPVEEGPVTVPEGDLASAPGGMRVVDADDAAAVAARGSLVDARAPERYRGESEPVDPVAGHVPGAVNVPATEHVDEAGRFKDARALTALYETAGVRPGRDVAVYCGSGVTATHGVLALELLGLEAALYPGSWSEWVADPRRPVERVTRSARRRT